MKTKLEEIDAPKRRQILQGALEVFGANGFDGASMDQIARTAGVSKGTLYVYFPSKEELFKALILEVRSDQADADLSRASAQEPLEVFLRQTGEQFLKKFLNRHKMSILRMVIGSVEKFPEFGALVFEAGAMAGRKQLAAVLTQRIERGELVCDDPFQAASQFVDLCGAWLIRKALFIPHEPISAEEIDKNVSSAVRVFLAAYAAPGALAETT